MEEEGTLDVAPGLLEGAEDEIDKLFGEF